MCVMSFLQPRFFRTFCLRFIRKRTDGSAALLPSREEASAAPTPAYTNLCISPKPNLCCELNVCVPSPPM